MRMKSTKSIKDLFTILIVLMPLLSVYAFPGVSSLTLGEPLLMIFGIIMMLAYINPRKNRGIPMISPLYWVFVLYVIMVSLVNTIAINEYSLIDTMTASFRLVFYTIVIFVLSKDNIDFDLLRKAYLIVCFITASYLIVQFISGMVFNSYLPSTFSNLRVMYSDYTGTNYNSFLYDSYNRLVFRPSSLFKEPSHMSRYIIYALPIIMFNKRKKNKFEIITFILVLIAVIITRSAMGFLGLGVFMAIWLYYNSKSKNISMKMGLFVVTIGLIIASVHFGLADQAIGRLSVETGSGGARIYRGFNIYYKMPFIFKVFGSGMGNYSAFASHFSITTIYDKIGNSGNNYMNLIATTLVSSGIVGFIIYLFSLVKLVWKKSATQIACFILFIFFAFGTNMVYYSAEYILPLLFMFTDINHLQTDDLRYIRSECIQRSNVYHIDYEK